MCVRVCVRVYVCQYNPTYVILFHACVLEALPLVVKSRLNKIKSILSTHMFNRMQALSVSFPNYDYESQFDYLRFQG